MTTHLPPAAGLALTISLLSLLAVSVSAADLDIRDKGEFAKVVPADAKVEKLADGFQFVEGPVWTDDEGGYLVFSDIPADRLLKWTAKEGITEFRKPSHQANGNTRDGEGRLVTCEHKARRVSVTEKDGTYRVLVDRSADGKKFNSPNDVAVKSDGSIWFTDPPYGGHKDLEQDKNYVFRFDPETGKAEPVAAAKDKPNGIAFSPDESKLYVADSGDPHDITVYEVNDDNTLNDGKPFATIDTGVPDGIRTDADGRLWVTAGDGVHVFNPDGKLIGKILVPESPANLCFGGEDGKTLFITARTSLYAVRTNVTAPERPVP